MKTRGGEGKLTHREGRALCARDVGERSGVRMYKIGGRGHDALLFLKIICPCWRGRRGEAIAFGGKKKKKNSNFPSHFPDAGGPKLEERLKKRDEKRNGFRPRYSRTRATKSKI